MRTPFTSIALLLIDSPAHVRNHADESDSTRLARAGIGTRDGRSRIKFCKRRSICAFTGERHVCACYGPHGRRPRAKRQAQGGLAQEDLLSTPSSRLRRRATCAGAGGSADMAAEEEPLSATARSGTSCGSNCVHACTRRPGSSVHLRSSPVVPSCVAAG